MPGKLMKLLEQLAKLQVGQAGTVDSGQAGREVDEASGTAGKAAGQVNRQAKWEVARPAGMGRTAGRPSTRAGQCERECQGMNSLGALLSGR
eukprot:183170-Chlamydomonas_euryale.AAC.9